MAVLGTLGWCHIGDANWVVGGSLGLARKLEERLVSLGAHSAYRSKVERILVEVRVVEPFPAQQRTNRPPLRTRIGFGKDTQLVFGGKPAPFGFRHDLRVGRLDDIGRLLTIATGLNACFV
jgi:hypothetical protein